MRTTRNMLLLRSSARRAPPTVLKRLATSAGSGQPGVLLSSTPTSTTQAQPALPSSTPQKRDYTVELARSTIDLGKQVPRDQQTPLSRLLNSITVEQMLSHKPDRTVYEVGEDEPVINAIRLMSEKKIGSVVVRGSETQLDVGMLSRIDCMRNLVLKNQFARETPISRVMNNKIQCVTPQFSLGNCLEIMSQAPNVRYLPVVTDIGAEDDEDTRVTGVLGQMDVLNWFVRSYLDAGDADEFDDARKWSAQEIFDREEKNECSAIYVNSDVTVYQALQAMARNNGVYVLVNKGQELAGIFTGTDYIEKIILPGRKSKDTNIMEVASTDLVTAAPHYTLIDCISLMLQNEIQHLPIGEWRQMLREESEDQRQGKSVTAIETDRYASSQPLGVITAYECIDYLDNQPKIRG